MKRLKAAWNILRGRGVYFDQPFDCLGYVVRCCTPFEYSCRFKNRDTGQVFDTRLMLEVKESETSLGKNVVRLRGRG